MGRGVIFDLDGTLLDTLEDLRAALNHALAGEGFPPRSLEETRRFVGNGVRNLVRRGLPPEADGETLERAYAAFRAFYAQHCMDKTGPYPGVPQLLRELRGRGYALGVVSNKTDEAVGTLCGRFFPGLLDFAAGERAGMARKPAPELVLLALDALGAEAEETVYVGDSEVDVETARNAGLEAILVTWGFRTREALEAAGARTLAESPEELAALLP